MKVRENMYGLANKHPCHKLYTSKLWVSCSDLSGMVCLSSAFLKNCTRVLGNCVNIVMQNKLVFVTIVDWSSLQMGWLYGCWLSIWCWKLEVAAAAAKEVLLGECCCWFNNRWGIIYMTCNSKVICIKAIEFLSCSIVTEYSSKHTCRYTLFMAAISDSLAAGPHHWHR